MFRRILIGAASGLTFVVLASPSMALDALMLPNAQSASTPSSTSQYFTSSPADKKDDKSSWHFSVSGNSGGRSMFAPNSFGPNSDPANPMGAERTYGPPTTVTNDPFFHN